MTTTAEALAKQFEETNEEVIAAVESCSDAHWQATTPSEGWTVAATACHIAGGHEIITGLIQSVANSLPRTPFAPGALDQLNAERARQYAHCGKTEAIEMLKAEGAAAAAVVRGLSDEQLGRAAQVGPSTLTAQQVIEHALLGHARGHLQSIVAAGAGQAV